MSSMSSALCTLLGRCGKATTGFSDLAPCAPLGRRAMQISTSLNHPAHDCFYLALAEEAEAGLQSAAQITWLRRLDDEHDNLRAALAWALDTRPEDALRLSGALHWFWQRRGHVRQHGVTSVHRDRFAALLE